MLLINEKIQGDADAEAFLTLPYEERKKYRFRAKLDNGQEVGLQLQRQGVLRDGDRLRAADGTVIQIRAGEEAVSTVYCSNPLTLARACYHLGNRHVPVQIDTQRLRYQQDHVLDDMLRLLGLTVQHEIAPFEPESGAYQQAGGHHHHHD